MQRTEPATLDLHGATWGPQADQYVMDASALRYEQYEICFAAKACLLSTACRGPAAKCSPPAALLLTLFIVLRVGTHAQGTVCSA